MSDTIKAAEQLLDEGMGAIDRPMWVAKAVMQVCREYLALVAKVRELRAAQSENFVERLVDLYMAAGIKE